MRFGGHYADMLLRPKTHAVAVTSCNQEEEEEEEETG